METSYSTFYDKSHPSAQHQGVPQSGFSIASGDSEKPILFTCYVTSCSVVTMYSPERKIGLMAHFDALTDINASVDKIAKHLLKENVELENLETKIFGGLQSSQDKNMEEVVVESSQLVNNLTEELTKRVKNVSTETFTKKMTSNEQIEAMQEHAYKLEELEFSKKSDDYLEKKKEITAKMDGIMSELCFSQILLNTENGKVETTSQLQYLVDHDERQICPAFSEKAQDVERSQLRRLRNGAISGKMTKLTRI